MPIAQLSDSGRWGQNEACSYLWTEKYSTLGEEKDGERERHRHRERVREGDRQGGERVHQDLGQHQHISTSDSGLISGRIMAGLPRFVKKLLTIRTS